MPRFASFEEARGFALRQDRISAERLAAGLGIAKPAAESLMRRLEAEGLLDPPDERGEQRVRDGLARRRSWSRAAEAAPSRRGPIAEEPEITRLRALAAEAEAWRRRALAAEARLATQQPGPGGLSAAGVATLRRRLARALHPDAMPGGGAGRELRDELFRLVWPQVDAALRGLPEEAEESEA